MGFVAESLRAYHLKKINYMGHEFQNEFGLEFGNIGSVPFRQIILLGYTE